MPVYTYRCENCGVQFDRYQKFQDQALTWCPECNKKSLHKVFQPVGIVFKGSGFYSTDHRSPSGQSRSNTDKSGDSKSEEKSEIRTDSKSTENSSTPPKSESKAETKSETKSD